MVERIKRLEPLFLEEINTLIARKTASGVFSGFITVTAIRMTKDLTSARVFFSVFGSDADRENAQHVLDSLKSEIGPALRKRIHIKRLPSFTFEFDDTPKKASKVEKIFAAIEKENEQTK